jgi:Bacterial protein of unknown function (DUF922)
MRTLTVLFISFLICTFTNLLLAQDSIHWSPFYKLKWEDFKAKPDSSSTHGAISVCSITYECTYINDTPYCKVYCFFKELRSWSKYKDLGSLLNHEQGHFDIAELFARKLRKSFSDYKINYNTVRSDIRSIFKKVISDRTAYDKLYDSETDFSRKNQIQIHWNKKIRMEIEKLDRYKD